MMAACTDMLYDESGSESGQDGLLFNVSTVEMGTEVVNPGTTRSVGSMGVSDNDNGFAEHPLEGENPYGLKVHREPLPLVGIHHGAVRESVILSQTQKQEPTRARANEIVKTDGTNFHDSLTIWGYTDTGTELFDQILLTKVRNWRNSVEWPYNKGDYMKFYAVAPSLEEINVSAAPGTSYSVAPTLTYTLPEKVSEMRDVLYGESEHISIASGPAGSTTTNPKEENLGKDNKHVSLQFHHITTAVRFSQGIIPSGLTITEISLEGVYAKGTYMPSVSDATTLTTGAWSGQTTTRTYSIATSHAGSGTTNVYIDNNAIMFMIPQTLPSGAKLQIKLIDTNNENKEHKLTCNISGDIWKKGYTVNYKITIGQLIEGYYLNAESIAEIEHSNTAVNGTVGLHSYREYTDYSSGVKTSVYSPALWKVKGYSNSEPTESTTFTGIKPTWLTDFRGTLDPSPDGDYIYTGGKDAYASYTVARQELALSTSHDVVLSANSQPASGWDLSKKTPNGTDKSSDETANCYIVNRTGSYYIPAVYGNMSDDNPSPQKSCFKDHKGVTITKKNIREQIGGVLTTSDEFASKAANEVPYMWSSIAYGSIAKDSIEKTVQVVLLWQDVNGLITSSTFSETYNNIGFTVSQSTPGNAVLALQARKVNFTGTFGSHSDITYGPWETLWTWHIWMTDEVYANDGGENETSYDAYFVNGSTDKEKAAHIARITNWGTNGTSCDILPVNLGWVPDELDFGLYKPRQVWVQIEQAGSGIKAVIPIKQHARQTLYTGTGTMYQWGRPTAFPSFRTVDGTVRHIYDISGNDITNSFTMQQAANGGDGIGNPYSILQWETNANSWFNLSSSDYATENAMWNSSSKTVYDPCPPGFRVPPVSIFTGFSKTGETVTNTAGQLNMWQETKDLNGVTQKSGERSKGGYFYCKVGETDRYGNMVYMPATGEFHGNKAVGTLMNDASTQLNNVNGIYWTSDYSNDATSKACFLWITPEQSFSAGTAEKPIIGFFGTDNKQNYYSSVRAIRPMKVQ